MQASLSKVLHLLRATTFEGWEREFRGEKLWAPFDLLTIRLPAHLLCPTVRVHQRLEVVAGGGVAVEIYAAGVLEDSVKFDHALRHHGQVGHHVVVAEEGAHGLEEVGELAGGVGYNILIGALRFKTPVPGVLEGGNLGGGLLACLFLEEDVVVSVGVEGRVEDR